MADHGARCDRRRLPYPGAARIARPGARMGCPVPAGPRGRASGLTAAGASTGDAHFGASARRADVGDDAAYFARAVAARADAFALAGGTDRHGGLRLGGRGRATIGAFATITDGPAIAQSRDFPEAAARVVFPGLQSVTRKQGPYSGGSH